MNRYEKVDTMAHEIGKLYINGVFYGYSSRSELKYTSDHVIVRVYASYEEAQEGLIYKILKFKGCHIEWELDW